LEHCIKLLSKTAWVKVGHLEIYDKFDVFCI
jgi:hypothetical protein